MNMALRANGRPIPAAPVLPGPPTYIWYGCDIASGNIIEELPFTASGALSVILGAYTTVTGTVALPDAPADWETACEPGRTMLVCVREDDDAVIWGGMVTYRKGGSGDTVELGLATLEAYFDRRYMTDVSRTNADGTQILIDIAYIHASMTEGINLDFDSRFTYHYHTRNYTYSSDQTLYSQMVELMNVQNGPEWTVEIRWANAAKTAFKKYLVTWPRLGTALVTAVFDLPGSIVAYDLTEDYGQGRGANWIEMYGDGEGDTRPWSNSPSEDVELLDSGFPRYEFRKTISGVTDPNTLQAHQAARLAWMARGAQTFTVTADASVAPRVQTAWKAGDSVAVEVFESPRHPNGFSITARAIGWSLETSGLGTVTPLLQEEEDDD